VSNIESGKIADLKAPVALRLAEELGTSVAVLTGAATQENTMPSGDAARSALLPQAEAFYRGHAPRGTRGRLPVAGDAGPDRSRQCVRHRRLR
jgi:hypothetical protein